MSVDIFANKKNWIIPLQVTLHRKLCYSVVILVNRNEWHLSIYLINDVLETLYLCVRLQAALTFFSSPLSHTIKQKNKKIVKQVIIKVKSIWTLIHSNRCWNRLVLFHSWFFWNNHGCSQSVPIAGIVRTTSLDFTFSDIQDQEQT